MIVLTRKVGEAICVGNDSATIVTVVRITLEGVLLDIQICDDKADRYFLAPNQSLYLGECVTVVVIETRLDSSISKARLGITAPQACPIQRKEVWDYLRRPKNGGGVGNDCS